MEIIDEVCKFIKAFGTGITGFQMVDVDPEEIFRMIQNRIKEEILKDVENKKVTVNRMKLKDSGLPQIVIDQTPKRARRAKVPVVKAKIGPKVTSLIADENVYDLIPVKAEIKAMISGIYITSINNFRKAPVPKPEKKGMMAKLRKKADDMTTK